jgi:thiamine biosynthesis lipoprotein
MSCSASVVVTAADPAPLLDRAVRRVAELEERWSRFLVDSEITGLNAAAGEPRRCSADTVVLVEARVRAWHVTGGAFDPTLLGTLVELGYAASRDDVSLRTSLAAGTVPRGRPDRIQVDTQHGVVQLPAGTTLDPGGLGKGLAADLVVAELLDAGADGALVEIGGDLRVAGRPPEDEHWTVEIRSELGLPAEHVSLTEGAVATSSSRLRTWASADEHRHHLIDPDTLRPTGGGSEPAVIGCTVVAGTAAWAEAFTKVAFVDGRDAAIGTYDRLGLAARVTTEDGTVRPSHAWETFA